MPDDCKIDVIARLGKRKGDISKCKNYKGISWKNLSLSVNGYISQSG